MLTIASVVATLSDCETIIASQLLDDNEKLTFTTRLLSDIPAFGPNVQYVDIIRNAIARHHGRDAREREILAYERDFTAAIDAQARETQGNDRDQEAPEVASGRTEGSTEEAEGEAEGLEEQVATGVPGSKPSGSRRATSKKTKAAGP